MAEKPPSTSPVESNEEEDKSFFESLTDAVGLTGGEEESNSNSNSQGSESPESEASPESERKEEDEEDEEEKESTPSFLVPEEQAPLVSAPAPKAKKPRAKREKRLPVPKDVPTFFRAMNKHPSVFKFTPTGDLQVPPLRGKEAFVIPLPFYTPLATDDRMKHEEERLVEMNRVQQEYDEMAKQLRDAIDTWRTTGLSSDVLRLQREMKKLSAELSYVRSPSRWTKALRGVPRRAVLDENNTLDKNLDHRVYILRLRSIANGNVMVASDSAPAKGPQELETPSPIVKSEEPPEVFILFDKADDPEHGDLSPETMVEFIFNTTKYNSPLQAYHGERLTKLNRKDLRPLLLRLRGAKQVRQFAARVVGDVEDPLALWIDILKTLVAQHPRFGTLLRETGTDVLVYANELEGKFGIGLAPESEEALDRDKWKGDNLLGNAWMAVRDSLPPVVTEVVSEGEGEEGRNQGGGGSYIEHGKTEQEAKEQRQKVLMGLYRRRPHP